MATTKNVVFVEEYTAKTGEKRKKYTTIGTYFETTQKAQSGEIFVSQSIQLDMIPTNLGKGFINILDKKEKS